MNHYIDVKLRTSVYDFVSIWIMKKHNPTISEQQLHLYKSSGTPLKFTNVNISTVHSHIYCNSLKKDILYSRYGKLVMFIPEQILS